MPAASRVVPIAIAISTLACDGASSSPAEELEQVRERSATQTALCDPEAYIAIRTDEACPDVPDWTAEQLFDTGTPWLVADDRPIPDAMGGVCRYRFSGPGIVTEADVTALSGQPAIDELSPSCTIVGGEGSVLTDTLGPALRGIFRRNTGRASAADLDLPLSGTPLPTVTVMVVDTAPADETAVPNSRHGRHMGNIIRDLACPDDADDCRVEVGYTVGMPRVADGARDYQTGGYFGTQADVAAAIYEATRRWEQSNAQRAHPTELVINLSLGWELEVFEGDAPDLEASEHAVRTALELASCKGAMIVAAAGNRSDSCDAVGPVRPAAWESLRAPDASRCDELGELAAPGEGTGYRPLVYAVGGLDVDLHPMPRARAGATAHLMASATHAAAGDPLHGGLTGTSVAAAAASGAAALVWSYRPELDAAQVMHWVYGSGDAVPGHTADFGLDGTELGPPRRVDACRSLQAACSAPLAQCPVLPLSSCAAASVPAPMDELATALATIVPAETLTPNFDTTSTSCTDACGNPVEISVAAGAVVDCGAVTPTAADEFAGPTPGPIGCSTCGVNGFTLELSLHPDYEDIPIKTATVTFTEAGGNQSRIELGELSLSWQTVTEIVLDEQDFPAGVLREASITLGFDGYKPTNDDMWIRRPQ